VLDPSDYKALTEAGLSIEEMYELIATIDLFQSVNSYTDLAGVEIDQL
jgi:alkylhydroperoxidase family enzyme